MDKVLYKIKSLDVLIIRNMVSDKCNFIKQYSLTPTQMQILGYVFNHNETYQKELENALNLRRATVSGVLQTMEKNKLIERVSTTKDARTKKIIVNESTSNIFRETQEKLENLEKIMIKNISIKDLEIFLKVIEQMKRNLEGKND